MSCRGLKEEKLEIFKNSTLFTKYLKNTDKLFLGIRDNYCNLYYMGASVCKIEFPNKKIKCTVANKYIDQSQESGTESYSEDKFLEKFDTILENINKWQRENTKFEKIAQQNLILKNNQNENASSFCIDMEYTNSITRNARFDIISLSKNKNQDGKYKIFLIELKYQDGAYNSSSKEEKKLKQLGENIDLLNKFSEYKFGSGILGHISDFVRYLKPENNEKEKAMNGLKQEICNIISNYKALDLKTPFKEPLKPSDIDNIYDIRFITVGNENSKCETQLKKYLFDINGSSEYSVQKILGNVTKKYDFNPIYNFTEYNCLSLDDCIEDILDDKNYEKYTADFEKKDLIELSK